MECESCLDEVPFLVPFTVRSNVGMLVARRRSTVRGHFCATCFHELAVKHSSLNIFVGWCSTVSLFLVPILLYANALSYHQARRTLPAEYCQRPLHFSRALGWFALALILFVLGGFVQFGAFVELTEGSFGFAAFSSYFGLAWMAAG